MHNKRVLDITITGKGGEIDKVFGFLPRFYGRVNRPAIRTGLNSVNDVAIEYNKLTKDTYAVNFDNAQIKNDYIESWVMNKVDSDQLKKSTCVTLPLIIDDNKLDTCHDEDYKKAIKWVCEKNYDGKIRINVHGAPNDKIGMCNQSLTDAGKKMAEWLINHGISKFKNGLESINWNACWTANTFPRIPPAYDLDKKCYAPDQGSILEEMQKTLSKNGLSGLNITGSFTTTYTDVNGTGKMGGFFSIPKLNGNYINANVFGQYAQIDMPLADSVDDNGLKCVLWYSIEKDPKITSENIEFKVSSGTISINRNEWVYDYNSQTKKLALFAPQGWNKRQGPSIGSTKLQMTAKDLHLGGTSITYRLAGSKAKVELEVH